MKRYYISILMVFMLGTAMCQDVVWGPKAGFNFSSLGRPEIGYSPRIGYHVGVEAEFITTPYLSVGTSLMYSLQGAVVDFSQRIFLNYHYLNLPVVAKIYFYEHASFDIGLQYGYLLKAFDKNEIGSEDRTDQVNRHDFAGVFGLSYKFGDHWAVGLRVNLGLSDTNRRNVIFEQRLTNRVLQVSGSYFF